MATLWSGSSTGSPVVNYTVLSETERSGTTVRVRFQVNARLGQSSYIGTGHTITFYGGSYSGSTQTKVEMLSSDGRWGNGHDGWYATPWFDVNTTSSSFTLYFFIEGSGFTQSQNIYGLSGTTDAPAFKAPTAPTWVSINPNPCNINNKPVISWGGAQAGSTGVVVYDVEVASSKSSGGWTEWARIASSQSATTYNEIVLANMNVNGQKPFVGVKYKYRIRSYDGQTSFETGLSAWKESPEITVEFTLPKAPNVYWAASTVKRNKSINVNWANANGGSGTITNYKLVVSLMSSNQTTVLSTKTYTQSSTTKTINVLSEFSGAKNGNYLKAVVYTNNSWGQQSAASNSAFTLVKGNQMWIKVNGAWKEGECYIKVNGAWKEGLPYVKVNGSWKESI